jgi:hypothetical protein
MTRGHRPAKVDRRKISTEERKNRSTGILSDKPTKQQ